MLDFLKKTKSPSSDVPSTNDTQRLAYDANSDTASIISSSRTLINETPAERTAREKAERKAKGIKGQDVIYVKRDPNNPFDNGDPRKNMIGTRYLGSAWSAGTDAPFVEKKTKKERVKQGEEKDGQVAHQ